MASSDLWRRDCNAARCVSSFPKRSASSARLTQRALRSCVVATSGSPRTARSFESLEGPMLGDVEEPVLRGVAGLRERQATLGGGA